ncbi:MAG: SDR family NAD(P)-dependent oxidoreductase [Bacteroidetes bacterium]|nr:SDR family NAD(P)-dependent oxidoreductase [Bacteroidota bacterium]MCH8523264.1 SDR family NAD(P)-dependent oxidoreductase [Balneolales bacterium]
MINRLKGKFAIITGATSGIGKELAYQLADAGAHLLLTGRRKDRLEDISHDITHRTGVQVFTSAFDISNLQECKDFYQEFSDHPVDILVNNAGLAAGLDPVQTAAIDDWEQMIDTNIKGLIYMTRLFLPGMLARNEGHILNVSSIAGHESYPSGSIYCATKHAVHAFTRSLKMDVGHTDIRVGLVSPGAVETEFSMVRFKGDRKKADSVYSGIEPLTAGDIAEIILFMLNRPPHVNILDTFVVPTAQSSGTIIHRKG